MLEPTSGLVGGLNTRTSSLNAPRASRAAFTLLEVILAMTIVCVIVLMIANMFQQISEVCSLGARSAEMNVNGRTALEFMAGELAQAVAGPIDAIAVQPGYASIPFRLESDKIWFATLKPLGGDTNENTRALRSGLFVYEDHALKYYRDPDFRPYEVAPPGAGAAVVLVENVVDFQAVAYSNAIPLQEWSDVSQLPAFVDLYIEVLSADDTNKLANADFVARNSQRYATRVYFNNRRGCRAIP